MGTQFTFERSEKKYIVDIGTAEQVKNEVTHYLPKERHNGSDVSFVRTVYFDNQVWKSYMDYKTDQKSRFKVRMRQYGTHDGYAKRCFFELKEKLDFMTFKKRVKLKQKWVRKFLEGVDLFNKLAKYNKELSLKELTDIYKEIQGHLTEYALLPVVEVLYQREAFEDEERMTRITFDRHLLFKGLPFAGGIPIRLVSAFPSDRAVIEIKTMKGRPNWLKNISDQFELIPQRFSKYATAVEDLFNPEVQPLLIPIEVQRKERFHGTIC